MKRFNGTRPRGLSALFSRIFPEGLVRSPLGEAVETVGIAVLAAFILRATAVQAYYIPSESMEETLLVWDHILVEKVSYRFRAPERGEIVVFDAPAGVLPSVEGEELVKRVVGLAGDRIRVEGGRLFLNGDEVTEDFLSGGEVSGGYALRLPAGEIAFVDGEVYLDGLPLDSVLEGRSGLGAGTVVDRSPSNFERLGPETVGVHEVVVPEGTVYVMGDHRSASADSRFFGFVPYSLIHGRAVMIYWPPSRMGRVA